MNDGKIPSISRGSLMESPEVVEQILILHKKGWGKKRIAKELGMSRNTIRRYLRQDGWMPYCRTKRSTKLDNLNNWLEETFRKHKGNSAVVHQEPGLAHQIFYCQ
jgi:uncharacterized protein YjcR